MKKGIIFCFSLFLLSVCSVFAETVMTIKEFYGGSVDFRAAIQTDAFYGSRGDGLRAGGTVSTLDFHQSFTSYNPACLAFMKTATASLGLIPVSLGMDTGMIASFAGQSVESIINENLEESFNDMTKTAGVTTSVDSIKGHIGQPPGITSLEIMVPFADNGAGFGIAREEKFTLEFDMLLNGAEMFINITDDENSVIDVDARAKVNALVNMDVRNVVTSFGLAKKITPIWAAGAVLERIESRFFADAGAQVDAIARYSGNDYEFNTRADNSLNAVAAGDLRAESWGIRFGTSLHSPDDSIETAVDFSIQPELKYKGRLDVKYHSIPDSIDISDVTLTREETAEGTDKELKIKLPSFARVTLAWKPGVIIAFNYTHYFDPFYISYGADKVHLTMMDAFRLGFNFGGFQLGGGIILSNEGTVIKNEDTGEVSKQTSWFPIPVLSMGMVIPFGKYIDAEMEFMAVPFPVLKSAVTYNF